MGSVDTKYMDAQNSTRKKRNAIGLYANSGLSQYVGEPNNASVQYTQGAHFPTNWDPRYTLYQGVAAFPDHREDYRVNKDGPREPAINLTRDDYYANYKDAPTGFIINGSLPVTADQGVHSLTDVPVFAMGPCQELFGGNVLLLPRRRCERPGKYSFTDVRGRGIRLFGDLLSHEQLFGAGTMPQWVL